MQDQISFGNRLRKQRCSLDLTQQAFANQVVCAEVNLRLIQAGIPKPSKQLTIILLERPSISETDWSKWLSFARGTAGLPPLSV
jgi:hypothetical protein